MVQSWHAEKEKLGKKNLDARGKQVLLYKLADIYTTLTRQHNGVVGDVARVLGGSLVAPPVEAAQIQRYFGDLKGFGAIDELITVVTGGVPVKAAPRGGAGPRPTVRQPPQCCRAFTSDLRKAL